MKKHHASATAQIVAAGVLAALLRQGEKAEFKHSSSHMPEPLSQSHICHWHHAVLMGSPLSRFLHWCASHRWPRALADVVERSTLPGITTHYLARKEAIEQHCRALLRTGVERVVVLGAGLDSLALRLSALFPDVQWIEVDHPETQALKQTALRGVTLPHNIAFLPLNLASQAEGLPSLLQTASSAPTLFIAEGLWMYFTPAQVDALVASIHQSCRASAGTCAVIATFMATSSDQPKAAFHPSSRLVEWWLHARNEPFLSSIDVEHLDAWCAARQLTLTTHQQAPFTPQYTLAGEDLFVAQINPFATPKRTA